MLKKFSKEVDVNSITLLKTSKGRAIRKMVQEQFPALTSVLDEIIPKKSEVYEAKAYLTWSNHVTIIIVDKRALFFHIREGSLFPCMHLLHMYPEMMITVQVDKGAIPYLMAGANCMAPGLTSAGGVLPDALAVDTPVAVAAEGKRHALGVGLLKMSSEAIRAANKGVAIELLHFIGDGLYRCEHTLGEK